MPNKLTYAERWRQFLILSLAFGTLLDAAMRVSESEVGRGFGIPPKPKIGIMRFEVGEDVKPSLGTFLYESFSGEMVASGAFIVVDWEQLDKVQKVVAQAQPNVSPEDARKMAMHQLGIEKLYLGSLAKVGSKFFVVVKLLNLDLTVERSERLPAASEDELESTVVKLARLLASNPGQVNEIKAHFERQKAEAVRWAEVQKSQTEESLTAFVKEFPGGVLAEKARKMLEERRTKQLKEEAEKQRSAKAAEEEAIRLKTDLSGLWSGTAPTDNRRFKISIRQKGDEIEINDGRKTLRGTISNGRFIATFITPNRARYTVLGTMGSDGKTIDYNEKLSKPPMEWNVRLIREK